MNMEACDSSPGKFDPKDAERLIALLVESGIPYQVEIGEKPKWGNAHQGAWVQVFVPGPFLQRASDLCRTLFPPESPPPREWIIRRG